MYIVPNVLPRSLCSWPCTSLHLLNEGHNHTIVRFAYLCHMIGEELVFFSFLYIKLFELGVEVGLNRVINGTNWRTLIHVYVSKRSLCDEMTKFEEHQRTNGTTLMLILASSNLIRFFHSWFV